MSSSRPPRVLVDRSTASLRAGWCKRGLRRGQLVGGLVALFVLASAPPALADRSFTTRFNADVPGNITMAANTLMVCPGTASGCTAARSTPPIASGSNPAINNNNWNMVYVNTAPGTVSGSPSFDSSSATLTLPPTATVLFAGLYWGADTSAGANQPTGGPAPHTAPGCPGVSLAGCPANVVGFQVPGGVRVHRADGDDPTRHLFGRVDPVQRVCERHVAGPGGRRGHVQRRECAGGHRRGSVRGLDAGRRLSGSGQPPRNLTVDDGFVTVSVGVAADHDPGLRVPNAAVGARARPRSGSSPTRATPG